jgi:hypothetical protein
VQKQKDLFAEAMRRIEYNSHLDADASPAGKVSLERIKSTHMERFKQFHSPGAAAGNVAATALQNNSPPSTSSSPERDYMNRAKQFRKTEVGGHESLSSAAAPSSFASYQALNKNSPAPRATRRSYLDRNGQAVEKSNSPDLNDDKLTEETSAQEEDL